VPATPKPKLDDPGLGLRNNGRRVLTYADLRSTLTTRTAATRAHDRAAPDRAHGEVRLVVRRHQVLRRRAAAPQVRRAHALVLVNDTMMTHPIHLHGMWSDLEDENGNFQVRKHTIDMPPGTRRSYRVTADALGRWAYHCHLLYTWKRACSAKCAWKNEGADDD
jgi:FtsP/CotA-like multicopper oxidase with cupredoxin domain